jgi:hypothetical protein
MYIYVYVYVYIYIVYIERYRHLAVRNKMGAEETVVSIGFEGAVFKQQQYEQ